MSEGKMTDNTTNVLKNIGNGIKSEGPKYTDGFVAFFYKVYTNSTTSLKNS